MIARVTLGTAIFFLALLAWARPFYSQVTVPIEGPGRRIVPIAIAPLKNLGSGGDQRGVSEGVADAIATDMKLSGWFRVVDRSAYIEGPQSGITAESFDFKNWTTIGAESLVKGGFTVQGDDLTVELRLFDVYQSKQLVGKRYSGKVRDFRRIAHRFADEIINQFTGTPGPFNTRLAYVSNGGGGLKEVYFSHLDGTDKFQVTNNRSINLSPAWSPDGRMLLYTSFREGRRSLFLYDLTTGREARIADQAGASIGGRWSPNGQNIAVSFERGGNTDVYILDRSGKNMRRMTEDRGIDVSPVWSPDGSRLAFVSSRSGNPQIYLMDVATGNVRRLTFSGTYNTSPDWAPKGDKIAFTGRVAGRFQIFTIPAQGGDAHQLTSGGGDNEDPSWAPDGRFIAFSSNRGGRYQLYMMRENGENQQRLTGSGGDDTNPSWSSRLE